MHARIAISSRIICPSLQSSTRKPTESRSNEDYKPPKILQVMMEDKENHGREQRN
jgi:hypothetical protein